MSSMTLCLTVADGMSAEDRDDLLGRVDTYVASGIEPERAQVLAANDLLADILRERVELDRLAREQHPDAFGAAQAEPEPQPGTAFDGMRPGPVFSRADTIGAGRIRRTLDELMAAAESMQDWRDWYDRHEDRMIDAFGSDAPLMKRLLSITSQAAEVKSNFTLALKAYQQWHALEPFSGFLPGVAANLERLRRGDDIRGPKIEQYEQAVAGYAGGIAVDRHIAQLMFNTDKPNAAQRKAAMRRIVDISLRMGWTPREVQSALWVFNQVRKGKDPQEVASYATLIDKHAERINQLTSEAADARRRAGGYRAFGAASRYAAVAGRDEGSGSAGAQGEAGVAGSRRLAVGQDSPAFRAAVAGREAVDENGDPVVEPPLAYSRAQGSPGQFSLPEHGIRAKSIEAVQNRYNRWKVARDEVARQGGTVDETSDFYAAEERYWGKVGGRLEDFQRRIEQFVKDVTADDLELGAVALYAYALHAPERNAFIAAKNANLPDGGSGMTNAQAAQIVADAQQLGIAAKLQRHADTLKQWTTETRDLLHAEGLITDTEWLEWTAQFTNYVPLKGTNNDLIEQFRKLGTGQGFNIRGKESKEATGRRTLARNIIEQIIEDRTRALIRAGKNEVLRAFAKFVLDNPSPNLWEVNAVTMKPTSKIDANGNRVIEEKPTVISDQRTVTLKDGGREIHILVKDAALLAQLANLNNENPNAILAPFLWVNKLMSRLYTSLSPVFIFTNAIRDTTAAGFGALDEIGFLGAAKLYAAMPRAFIHAWRAEVLKKPSAEYQLYRSTGGKTGFMAFTTIDDRAKELAGMAAAADRYALDPRNLLPAALALIEDVNASVENAIRFASFRAALASGETVARAASVSKNITVNFNRRGTMTHGLSAMYLFFNPAVQGTTRVLQALKSPKVMGTLGLAMMGVAALALRNASMGEDDDGVAWWDKIPDEVKERNLIIMLPPGASEGEQVPGSKIGRYVKIPMPYGYNFFAVTANQVVDVWRNSNDPARGRTVTEAGLKMFQAFMGAWVPVPELGRSFDDARNAGMALIPDAIAPLAQTWFNLSAFGRDLYPDSKARGNEGKPDSALYFAGSAGTIFQRAAQGMNEATGGNEHKAGWIDVHPASIENVARAYGGAPLQLVLDTVNAMYARQSIQRESLEARRLPLLKQFYGQIDAETDRMISSQRMNAVAEAFGSFESARKAGDHEVMEELRSEMGPMLRVGASLRDYREALGAVRDRELAVVSSDEPESVKYVRLQGLATERRRILQRFNERFNEALREKVSAD